MERINILKIYKNNMENKKVLLGMSGGGDSSVSALLLKEQGYEVIGATMKLWESKECDEEGSCCSIDSTNDAKKVCSKIDIPHYTLNCQKDFKTYVIEDFIDCYKSCKTPNPCIECNKYLKFGAFYKKSIELECNYIATGQYAKVEYSKEYKRYVLKKSNSIKKDQSYVLWNIPKEILPHIIFPLGDFENKEQIRKIAKNYNLSVANKPDSEDICFIPDGNYKKFLEENSNIKPQKGNIVNKNGEILGKHLGLYNYTIGQRKGLGISYSEPLFVIGFNVPKNEVIVGTGEEIYRTEMYVNNINLLLIDDLKDKMEVSVKVRYSSKEEKATIEKIQDDLIKVTFKNPVARITSGQSAVFYVGDIVLGGGKII